MGSRDVPVKTTLGMMLWTYRTLSYTWRHALGEIVDNCVDSYIKHREDLPNGIDIRINYDGKGKQLTVVDNAYGMNQDDIDSAVQVTRRYGSGYFEGGMGRFGLGLKKSATCLGDNWKVITKQKGSITKYTAPVDVKELYETDAETVKVLDTVVSEANRNSQHGTRVEIEIRKNRHMRGDNESRVKEHIAEMYRFFMAAGEVRIYWNDEPLEYKKPPVRKTDKDGVQTTWDTDFELQVKLPNAKNKHTTVKGNMYILETMSNTHSGIQLFWRNRMIVGGHRENWRPTKLVGGLENYRARRFCAAIHLDMLEINHQKDGLIWDLFSKEDLLEALISSSSVKSYLSEANKEVGRTISTTNIKNTAKNIKKRLGSKSVQNTVNREKASKKVDPTTYPPDLVEKWAQEAGTIETGSKEPITTISFTDMEYGPVLTSCVTGQKDGFDLLRILINKGHEYFNQAIISEGDQELWTEFMHAIALTKHTLSGAISEKDLDKIIDTIGKMLAGFRASDEE